MGLLRKILVVLLAILLILGFSFASTAITAERTVLNADFVKDTIDDEELHKAIHEEIISTMKDVDEEEPDDEMPEEIINVLGEAVSPDFLRDTIHTNIDFVYEYMDGEKDEIVLEININETRDKFEVEMESLLQQLNLTEITEIIHEEEIEEREVIHEYQGIEFTLSMVDRMLEDEGSYNEVIDEYRSDLADEVGEDQVDELIQQFIDEVRDELEENAEVDEEEDAFKEAYADLLITPLQSISDEDDYSEFKSSMEEAKTDLSSAFTTLFYTEMLDEFPDEINLNEELDEDEIDLLEDARDYLQMSGLFIVLLTVVLLVFVALIWLASGSLITTAYATGASALIASLLGITNHFTTPILLDELMVEIREEAPEAFAEFIETFIMNIVGTHTIHSIILLIIALILIGTGYYLSRNKKEGDGGL
ncbi:hypothetical protein [Methanonatronarchaeum sp. AMET6-2]|uniref:hypothetical protein n=1 Tax=Methanonatronarchaeum sp. AMET6-2 TaxID=2933293 RepID=UPI0011F981E5|nr:hypothetical protein [Methanonatronarchaeum sp. AMET6-2]RZN62913.1 MAG: hypothetical protein EF811_01655 [Methanonatronarchaeia archaeon]UOY09845.1 hypothetical protein MU439_06175 [Methanonatronarchaeum sp. AMET6-2]